MRKRKAPRDITTEVDQFWQRVSGYGECPRCRRRYDDDGIHFHAVMIDGSGDSALCDDCWNECTTDERVRWFRDLRFLRILEEIARADGGHLGKASGDPLECIAKQASTWPQMQDAVRAEQ